VPEREEPKVDLRGPAEGDSIILPMGGLRAHITRKASRTETGGHWALGEAWQDPGGCDSVGWPHRVGAGWPHVSTRWAVVTELFGPTR
jgi:hypothetical protein